MVAFCVFILLIGFESSKVFTAAFTTYCTVPCPLMCPAQQPSACGAIQLPPRRLFPMRSSFNNNYSDYDYTDDGPVPNVEKRQKPVNPDPPPTPKPKPKPPPTDDPEPPPKKKNRDPPNTPASPTIQPARRFFTSLFSIPGAVVDTLIGGEVVL